MKNPKRPDSESGIGLFYPPRYNVAERLDQLKKLNALANRVLRSRNPHLDV